MITGASGLEDPILHLRQAFNDSELHFFNSQLVDSLRTTLPRPFLRCLTPVYTIGQGNCFYHIVFGSQDFHHLVRIRLLLDVLENEVGYRSFTQRAITVDNYDRLVQTLSTLGAWAGDAALYAASRVLQRPIHVYGEFPNAPPDDEDFAIYMRDPRNRNHRRTLYDDEHAERRPISIHVRANHFVALLPLNDTDFPCGSDEYALLRRFGLTSPSTCKNFFELSLLQPSKNALIFYRTQY
jgi:hypothetical protein